MTPLGHRKKLFVGVVCALVTILVAVAVLSLSASKPGLRILEWNHSQHFYTHYPPNTTTDFGFSVTVINEGDSIGNGTIRCEVRQVNATYYGTREVSLASGSTMTCGVSVLIYANLPWLDLKVTLDRH